MSDQPKAAVAQAGEGIANVALGRRLIRLTAEQTGGVMGVWEEFVAPSEGPPAHVHGREDEMFHVLEGRFAFWCDGVTTEAGPGAVVVLKRGTHHRFWNAGDTDGRLFVTVTPGGFEGVFLACAERGLSDPEEIGALFAEYGLAFDPPAEADAA